MLARMLRKRNSHTLLVGMQAHTTILENNMVASQKTKLGSAIGSINTTPRKDVPKE
jgi:hypothetical protein